MPTDRFSFPGHDGARLAARLDLPPGRPRATALFAHCFTCGKDIPAARRIAQRLTALGFAVLRFDFTGLGHSAGEFENTSFTSNVEDLQAACAALTAMDMAPSLLIGHSLGGAAVLKAAAQMDGVKAVVTIGAPFDPGHLTRHFEEDLPRIREQGVAEVQLAGRRIRISQGFLDDIAAGALAPAISRLNAALLVLHGPRDDVVGIDNASEIFLAARHPKSFVTLDDADHLLTRAEDAHYAADLIATWAGRYVDLADPDTSEGVPEGVTRVSEVSADGFLQDIRAGRHVLAADEPADMGGTDKAPSPYGLLAAGLGACTSMTIRIYARRKGWPLEGVSVDVSHAKTHATDAADPGGKIDRFTRVIRLDGDLDDDQRARLLQIADKCPVHRTLERANRIETSLAE
ncbi:MAG: putative redox protein YhfA [Rhodobacteraceae bacterium HLUCCA08]|nr:MAG: putative redox protein YhfA [Rhodobacteraceae bacterium HLUCCA08]